MNIFAGQNIYIPNNLREFFARYCQTRSEGSKNKIEDSPFPRMVDFWFLGLGIAAERNLQPIKTQEKKDTYNAIEGNVLSDDFRADTIMLFCISKHGSIDILDNPAEMLRFANSYALAGIYDLVSELNKINTGIDEPLDYLSNLCAKYLKTK